MDDDASSVGGATGPVEPIVVEVEVVDARGLDLQDAVEESESDLYFYEASMQLVSSLTGDPIPESGVQWVKLRRGRRMTFMTPRWSPDKFVFGGVTASSLLAVRFDVFRKKMGPNKMMQSCQLIGIAEVTPWIVVKEDVGGEDAASRYCRWVRLVEDTTQLPGKRRGSSYEKGTQGLFGSRRTKRAALASSSSPQQQQDAPTKAKRQRSEIRVKVTSKIGTGDSLADSIAVADANPKWFTQPKPAVDPQNVVRIAVLRSSEVLSANSVVAARLTDNIQDVDDPSVFFGDGDDIAVTRPSSFGVWMQTIELAVPKKLEKRDRNDFFVDVAVMHRVVTGAGKNHGDQLLLRRAVVPMANVLSDDPCWIDFKPNGSLKLALRWDYDETLDRDESRPFFDCERFGDMVEGGPPRRNSKKKKKPCNAVRVVVARARNLPTSIESPSMKSASPPALVPGDKYSARVSLSLGGLSGLAPGPQNSVIATVAQDGSLVWNECFEFVFPQESKTGTTSVRVDLEPLAESAYAGEDTKKQATRAAVFEIPRVDVSRRWHEMMETDAEGTPTSKSAGLQIEVLGTRFYDPTLNQEDMRSIVTEALSFAFPEVDLRSIERVYDSTKDVADACVALSSLTASTDRDSDMDSNLLVASCNATDLAWAIPPITEEKGDEDDEDDDDEDDPLMSAVPDVMARRENALAKKKNLERQRRLFNRTATAIMLTRDETVKLIKNHPISEVDIGILDGNPKTTNNGRQQASAEDGETSSVVSRRSTNYSSTNGEYVSSPSLSSPSSGASELRQLQLNPEVSKRRPRGRQTTVKISSTLEDTSEQIRAVSTIKIDVAVDRTPRDFVTLRNGLIAKLGKKDDAIPPLPKWVRKALRLPNTSRRAATVSGAGTAGIITAVALVTGFVAPVFVPPVALGVGVAFFASTDQVSQIVLRKEIQKEIAKSTWLSQVAQALAANKCKAKPDRLNDAVIFFKQFMAHGSVCTMHAPPKRKTGSLPNLGCMIDDDDLVAPEEVSETKEAFDNLSVASSVPSSVDSRKRLLMRSTSSKRK